MVGFRSHHFGFIAIYFVNDRKNLLKLSSSLSYPLMITAWSTVQLVAWLALAGVIMTLIYLLVTRKFSGFWEFVKSNFRIGLTNILRCVVISGAFIIVGYLMLSLSDTSSSRISVVDDCLTRIKG